MEDYQKQGRDFLEETGTKFKAEYIDTKKYFPDDKDFRDVYKITLKRKGKSYSFTFGQSIANSGEEPTPYDILTCLTKYDPGDFQNFCGDFGYSDDSIKANGIHKSVVKEWAGVQRLFSDVIEKLQEIQ